MTKSEQDAIKQYRIIAIVIIIALVLAISSIIGTTHYKKYKDDKINIVLNDGDLIINYVDGNIVEFNDKKEHEYLVSVTNNGDNKIFFSLELNEVIASNKVDYVVTTLEGEEIVSDNIGRDGCLFSLLSVEGNNTLRYKIVFKPNKKSEFKGTLNVINDSLTTQTFSDLILLDNNISVAKTKVGSEIADDDEGLITTNDSDGISYYFRGNVKNNYVLIDDLMFRIVRINGDGTVRLVLDDVIAVNTVYNNKVPLENETYNDMALLEKASVMETLNNWVNSALSNYSEYLANGKYCSDNTFTNLNGGIYRSDTYNRIFFSQIPSLACSGVVYSSKVGLLSADEVTMAGAFQKEKNNKYYLYNENINSTYVLSSSDYLNANNCIVMFGVNEDGSLNDSVLATDTVAIRPVINLNMSAKIKGKGTLNSPYILVS